MLIPFTNAFVHHGLGMVLLLSLAVLTPVQAQPDPIASDRPGIGDGAATVAPGRFQVETGYSYADLGAGTQHNFGELLFRYGVTSSFELRAAVNSFIVQRGSVDADGFGDSGIGFKYNLVRGTGRPMGPPQLTLLASTSLPTGADAFGSDELQPTIKLTYDWPLSDVATLSANGGYTFPLDDAGHGQYILIGTLGVSFPGAEGLGAYAGYAGFYDEMENQNYLEGGVTYLVNSNTQVDLNGGLRVDGQDELFVGFGFAHRF